MKYDSLTAQLLLIFLAFVSGCVSYLKIILEKVDDVIDSEDEKEIKKRRKEIKKQKTEKLIASILLLSLLATSLISAFVTNEKDKQTKFLDRQAQLYKQQSDEAFSLVAEASGGVAIGKHIYLVDDDKPKLLRAEYVDDEKSEYFGKYDPRVEGIDLYTKLPSETEPPIAAPADLSNSAPSTAEPQPETEKPDSHILKKGHVNDFEAAAYYNEFIYLVTSHSDSKSKEEKKAEGKARQRFLEVKLETIKTKKGEKEIGIVTRWANLRVNLDKALFGGDDPVAYKFTDIIEASAKTAVTTVMQIEGLAIKKGEVYLGFRGPDNRDKNRTLVAKTTLDEIFRSGDGEENKWKPDINQEPPATTADFSICLLDIGGTPEDERGIVDMFYWEEKDTMLILTNSIKKYKLNARAEILKWSGEMDNKPILLTKKFYEQPNYVFAKPEVLLLPAILPDKAVIFLDGQNFGGGQRIFSRKDNNIE